MNKNNNEENFNFAFRRLMKNEGGYVNDPRDVGGETKYGISKRSYPNLDIKNLTIEEVKNIYKKDFWDKGRLYLINDRDIAYKVFDMSVNMGCYQAAKMLQRAMRSVGFSDVYDNGVLTNNMLHSINGLDSKHLLSALRSECAAFYRILAKKPRKGCFLRGWLIRAYS